MCNFVVGIVTGVVGLALVIISSIVGYAVVPNIVDDMIVNEVVLQNDTIQFERFEEIPFPLNFTVRLFNVTNREEILSGGIPVVNEVGPYVYKLYQSRIINNIEDDKLNYRILYHFEFDAEASFPNAEDDVVTIANTWYNAILQVAEEAEPSLMGAINLVLNGIFGAYNAPITDVVVRTLLFDGVPICSNPDFFSALACNRIREMAPTAKNLEVQEDGTIMFSLFGFKNEKFSNEYEVYRGVNDISDLGRIITFNQSSRLHFWTDTNTEMNTSDDAPSVCNTLKGTDSGLFPPFIDRNSPIYAFNSDICRSVELRYESDVEHEGIPLVRFSAKEWFLDDADGCYCLNHTQGLTKDNGCLFEGAMELYSCVDSYLVLTYPHFLYADPTYRNNVIGVTPNEDLHRIMLDLEPNSGVVIKGAKRAQFNFFLRPIQSIAATNNIRTTLMPVFWVEEGVELPEEYIEEVKSKLLRPLRLIEIIIPVVISICGLVLLVGVCVAFIAKRKQSNSKSPVLATNETTEPNTT